MHLGIARLVSILGRGWCIDDLRLRDDRIDDRASRNLQFVGCEAHRGVAGSGAFLSYAVWETVEHFRRAFENPEFRAKLDHYSASAAASPHLLRKAAVAGICVA
jgi:hypothetical protein